MSLTTLQPVSYGSERTGLTRDRFYALVRENFFPPGVIVRFGRQIRVNPSELEKFLSAGGMALPGGWRRERGGAAA